MRFLLFLALFMMPSFLFAQLIFEVDTDLGGVSNIGLELSTQDSIQIDWGDGSALQIFSDTLGQGVHSYDSAGVYTIEINGQLNVLRFTREAASILTRVLDFGDLGYRQITFASSGPRIQGAPNLTEVPSTLPASVRTLNGAFFGASVFNGDLTGWDVSNITDFSLAFYNAREFNGDLSGWDVSSATNMSNMFYQCRKFNSDISSWSTSNVTNMEYMFHTNLAFDQDISGWDVSKVANMRFMFNSCIAFNQDLNDWDVSSVQNMDFMFSDTQNFNQDLDQWDVSFVRSMRVMFGSNPVFNGNISTWDVSRVFNMESMFRRATSFNGDIVGWDVSNVQNFRAMFEQASSFNVDISGWDVSAATTMQSMFATAEQFDQDLGSWDVSSVDIFENMFFRARKFNAALSQWEVSNATNFFGMFREADVFNGDVSTWDVSNATRLGYIFADALVFNQDVSSWDVSNVIDFNSAFRNAAEFGQDLSSWNVGSSGFFSFMFAGATSFNSDISGWDMTNAINIRSMFNGASSFDQDLSAWDVSNVENFDSVFDGAEQFNGNIASWNVQSSSRLDFILNRTNIDPSIYAQILIEWSMLDSLQQNTSFGAGSNQYALNAIPARKVLVDAYGWTIVDGGSVRPSLATPTNDALLDGSFVGFTWDGFENATQYEFQLSTAESFESVVLTETTADTSFSYTELAPNTRYYWRVRAFYEETAADWSEPFTFANGVPTNLQEEEGTLPLIFTLEQNYPNPFNPITTISYSLSQPSPVMLIVYNTQGQVVSKLVDTIQNAGQYTVSLNAANLPSGIYFYRLQSEEGQLLRKMTLLK